MKSRMLKLTATASATALLAGFGAVAATSASAATAPAAAVAHSAAVPAGVPASAFHKHGGGDEDCVLELLGLGILCGDDL